MSHPHRYDAFLSYRRQEPDRTFVRDLLARLEKAGYTVATDERDFASNRVRTSPRSARKARTRRGGGEGALN